MKLLENQGWRGDDAIDEILDELKGTGGPIPKADQSELDAILAELGIGEASAANGLERPVPPPSRKPQVPHRPPSSHVPPPVRPADVLEERMPKPPAPKATVQAPTVWEEAWTEPEPEQPRVGKAAALDKVEPGKYKGETELLSWFSDQEGAGLSKKEQKQVEKDRRRRLAEERKEAKQEAKRRAKNGEDEEDFEEEPDAEEIVNENEQAGLEFDLLDGPEEFSAEIPEEFDLSTTLNFEAQTGGQAFNSRTVAEYQKQEIFAEDDDGEEKLINTQTYELEGEAEAEAQRVPTAAFTQEFETEEGEKTPEGQKNLFVDDMVDDKFRQFFEKTVIVDKAEVESGVRKGRRKNKKSRSALLTGEFSRLAEEAEMAEDEYEEDEMDDYNRPQDAGAVEKDLFTLRKTLTRRTVATLFCAVGLLWMALGFAGTVGVPAFMDPSAKPLYFGGMYLLFIIVVLAFNFTTVSSGLVGLFGEPTVDTAPALAAVGVLLQGVVVMVQLLTKSPVEATLFGVVGALLLAFNSFGKRLRANSIIDNFRLASAGFDHSAAYVLDDSHELAFNITRGLEEENPSLLVSRPTALVKGFLRQSFSQRWSDRMGRIIGWVIMGSGILVAVVTFLQTKNMLSAVTAFTVLACVGAPLSSSLVSAVPSALLQRSTSKVGAVVPGWSAIEELGQVNVVMAGARDIFPPSSVRLQGIKTFEKERVDLAILYAASVLIEGCDTMRDIFLGVIQGKQDMLYKVESLVTEPGRGFTAWVENSRVVIGTREMLQKHDIDPPPIEVEMRHVTDEYLPVYLAVSGKLIAMFVIGYHPDEEVAETLEGLIKSGVSLLVTSDDMNVTGELIERVYHLPASVVKVLGRRELEMLEPLTAYLPESDGVMTHIGTFTSFIGGMRAAAGCAASERMSGIVQIASVVLACLLCGLLVFSGGLPTLALSIAVLYHVGWTVLVCALPFARRY